MNQKVESIHIKDLVLWTENPREPIDPNGSDQDVVDLAFSDNHSKWTLAKLSKEMGDFYDFSELPTVVYHGQKPVVYDGNRRMILAKIKHGLVTIPLGTKIDLPEIPEEVPCNVCIKKIALVNVLRKHSDSGSWLPLERDIFLHKFMGKEKSPFLILEEDTGIITANPHLNKRFVKDEIFREDILKSLGFSVKNGKLNSQHTEKEAIAILADISTKVKDNVISTRENRGKVVDVLAPTSQQFLQKNKNNSIRRTKIRFHVDTESPKSTVTRRTHVKKNELFGGKLFLRIGEVSNLYRDIVDLYNFYKSNQSTLSNTFPGLIRMSLRLLVETAAKEDKNKKMDTYLTGHFAEAKSNLNQDVKTSLSNHNINQSSIIQLLHTGAHNYQTSNSIEQTVALSIAIGSIVTISHGKE
ncbi:MAG: hypothetical protein HOP08_12450 [Cyclobacteriaceae bacterium]|nr:hypothetical protein [Cyclobacteriaceae bacterium]